MSRNRPAPSREGARAVGVVRARGGSPLGASVREAHDATSQLLLLALPPGTRAEPDV